MGRLAVLLVLLGLAATARAETQGPYVHDTLRRDDEKLIACYDSALAVEIAKGVNAELLAVREALLAAVDDAARQQIYQDELYPSPGWTALMDAIYGQRCDLIDVSDQISRRTLYVGPAELGPLGASHSVVETELLYGDTGAAITAWVVTTQEVPPVGE